MSSCNYAVYSCTRWTSLDSPVNKSLFSVDIQIHIRSNATHPLVIIDKTSSSLPLPTLLLPLPTLPLSLGLTLTLLTLPLRRHHRRNSLLPANINHLHISRCRRRPRQPQTSHVRPASQLSQPGDQPAHLGDFVRAVLEADACGWVVGFQDEGCDWCCRCRCRWCWCGFCGCGGCLCGLGFSGFGFGALAFCGWCGRWETVFCCYALVLGVSPVFLFVCFFCFLCGVSVWWWDRD